MTQKGGNGSNRKQRPVRLVPDQLAVAAAVVASDLLRTHDAAPRIGLKPQTLSKWRSLKLSGQPKYLKIGHLVFYRAADLEQWLVAQTVQVR